MKKENKNKLIFLALGLIVGIVLTLLFQFAILGNANKVLVKNSVNTMSYLDLAGDCLNNGGTAITNPNPHYGDDGVTYYPQGSFTCVVSGVATTTALSN